MLFLSVRPQVTFDWIYGLDLWLEVSSVAPGFRQAEILDLRVRNIDGFAFRAIFQIIWQVRLPAWNFNFGISWETIGIPCTVFAVAQIANPS